MKDKVNVKDGGDYRFRTLFVSCLQPKNQGTQCNNKSSGCDNLRAEHSKYAPSEILEEIAVLLNNVAETGNYPKEIKNDQSTTSHSPINPKKNSSNMPY